ncbi:notch-regulated ankyrin repeat-containing protein-like [Patiria miniata]|uniref:Notch-regulated ankyrin repeat-containing protein n=1 Tax=Patiria miniata TaxID=46514 RepID=A0A913Z551_PATMI|nr:notch-regulated ankyrin repeat-containing protein-like [Patiria miniata]
MSSTYQTANPQRSFHDAVRRGDPKELTRLLSGALNGTFNVNVFDGEGQTPLHQSVLIGDLELVKLLVQFGADVRLANKDGWNALHIAAYGGHDDIVLYLIRRRCGNDRKR